jgi:imidazolonepropionase-like amidohydrolase
MKKPITRRDFIKKTPHVAAVFYVCGNAILTQGCSSKEEFDILIKDGNLLDLSGNRLFLADIGISGNMIKQVGKIPKSKGKFVIDAKEKFIIPGLCDMHVHFTDQRFSELFLLNGVTSVRDVGNKTDFILSLREKINSGKLRGPTIFASGPIINNRKIPQGASFYTEVVKNPEQAKKLVEQLARKKVDWIKIYISLPRNMVRTIIQEAEKYNLPVAGHLRRVDARFAAHWGIKTLEHATGIAEALLGEEEFEDAPPLKTISNKVWLHVDKTKYKELIDLFVEKDVCIVANLTFYHAVVATPEELKENPYVKLMPKTIQQRWNDVLIHRAQMTTEDRESWEITQRKLEEFLILYKERGGKTLAGTDTPWPFLVPGFSLHKELELLVEAGFSPQGALLTATKYSAEVLNQTKNIGTIEEGKMADLLLLKSNPLEDIRNTQNIEIIIKNGKVIHREKLYRSLIERSSRSDG